MPQISKEELELILELMLERAATKGAHIAMGKLGLHDDNAQKDVAELRSLLDSWRDVRRTIWKTISTMITAFFLGALAIGASAKFWETKP